MGIELDAFDEFLTRLEPRQPDADSRYKRLRMKLVKFFSWRNCHDPEALADETIQRTVGKVQSGEGPRITHPYSYVYGIAWNVFKAYLAEKKRSEQVVQTLPELFEQDSDQWYDCRRQCLQELSPEKLSLIREYYLKGESAERMAQASGMTVNALRLQVYRIKNQLRECYIRCVQKSSN